MITLALLGILTSTSPDGSPFWASNVQAKLQPMLRAKAKPLRKRDVEAVFNSLGYKANRAPSCPVLGCEGCYLVSFATQSGPGCTFWIEPTGNLSAVIDEKNASPSDLGSLIFSARLTGKTLVVAGMSQWSGNAPHFSFQTFARRNGNWKRTSYVESERQAANLALPVLTFADGIVRVQTSDYPEHMDASHGAAQATFTESFRLTKGRFRRQAERKLNTAYNTLDELAGALASGRKDTVNRIVPSAKLRTRLASVWDDIGQNPSIQMPRNDRNESALGWSNHWFHFAKRAGRWVIVRIDRRGG